MKKSKENQSSKKALKHQHKPQLAVLTTPTIYLSTTDGEIFNHFPNRNFNAAPYSEVVEFPCDFEDAKSAYFSKVEEKKRAKEAERKATAEAAYQERRRDVLNLWRWRHGEAECYAVASFKWVMVDGLNWEQEDHAYKLFFNIEEANAYFDEVLEDNKDFCEPGYGFYVQITELTKTDKVGRCINIPVSDRLQITSIDDIYEEYISYSNVGGFRSEVIDNLLPDDAVIVTSRRGEWHHANFPELNMSYGDLYVDRGEHHYSDEVYRLSELSPSRDYDLLQFIISELNLSREDLTRYMDEKELDMLFDNDEE
jgi:hypothetical protein